MGQIMAFEFDRYLNRRWKSSLCRAITFGFCCTHFNDDPVYCIGDLIVTNEYRAQWNQGIDINGAIGVARRQPFFLAQAG